MKTLKFLLVILISVMLFLNFAACGKTGEGIESSTASTSESTEDPKDVPEAKEQNVAVYDYTTTVDKLLGKWQQISAPDRIVTISQVENGYQYEDKEGKYPATFEQGLLKVKATETDTVMVYIHRETGRMIIDFNGTLTECEKSK